MARHKALCELPPAHTHSSGCGSLYVQSRSKRGRKEKGEGGEEGKEGCGRRSGEVKGKRMQLISEDKSSKVGQLSHWVNFLKSNDLGNITFC